jgi:hypothetical protein
MAPTAPMKAIPVTHQPKREKNLGKIAKIIAPSAAIGTMTTGK